MHNHFLADNDSAPTFLSTAALSVQLHITIPLNLFPHNLISVTTRTERNGFGPSDLHSRPRGSDNMLTSDCDSQCLI